MSSQSLFPSYWTSKWMTNNDRNVDHDTRIFKISFKNEQQPTWIQVKHRSNVVQIMGKVFLDLHLAPCSLMPTTSQDTTKKEDHKNTIHVLEMHILPPLANARINHEAEIRASTLWVNTNCHNIYRGHSQPMKRKVNAEQP